MKPRLSGCSRLSHRNGTIEPPIPWQFAVAAARLPCIQAAGLECAWAGSRLCFEYQTVLDWTDKSYVSKTASNEPAGCTGQ